MIARVLGGVNLHTATDTINKLTISLFENVIVSFGGRLFPEALEDKSNVSQGRKVRFA
jgi:hypothetical protein